MKLLPGLSYSRLRHRSSRLRRWASSRSSSLEDSDGMSLDSNSEACTECSSLSDDASVCDRLRPSVTKDRRSAWCKLAYWEESKRVGGQFPVEPTTVDVYSSSHLPNKGPGFCLDSVFEDNPMASEKIVNTRKKIGQGIILSRDESTGDIWLYNRSGGPLFVNSPSLDPPGPSSSSSSPSSSSFSRGYVSKIAPDHTAKVFDYGAARLKSRLAASSAHGPRDEYSVYISFAKGWGQDYTGKDYTRQEVLACPCWLQVCLKPR